MFRQYLGMVLLVDCTSAYALASLDHSTHGQRSVQPYKHLSVGPGGEVDLSFFNETMNNDYPEDFTTAFFIFGVGLSIGPTSVQWPGDTIRACRDPREPWDNCAKQCMLTVFKAAFNGYIAHAVHHRVFEYLLGGNNAESSDAIETRSSPRSRLRLPVELDKNNLTTIPGYSYSSRVMNSYLDDYGKEKNVMEIELLHLASNDSGYGRVYHNSASGKGSVIASFETPADRHLRKREHCHHNFQCRRTGVAYYLFEEEDRTEFDRVNFDHETIARLTDQVVAHGKKDDRAVFCVFLEIVDGKGRHHTINKGLIAFLTSDHEKNLDTLEEWLQECKKKE